MNSIANLREDIAAMRELRTKIDQAVQDTIAATRIMDAFKGPHGAQQSAWLKNYANFPLEYATGCYLPVDFLQVYIFNFQVLYACHGPVAGALAVVQRHYRGMCPFLVNAGL